MLGLVASPSSFRISVRRLIVGPVFQPLVDRLRVSRQKLAFVLDSTSSPVAILIPFIGWGVFIMSVIASAFESSDLSINEWGAFVAAVPYQFYAWLAIAIVPILTFLHFDYGPMAVAENEAGDAVERSTAPEETADDKAKPILIWLPLAVLGVSLFTLLGAHGFPFEQVSGPDFRAGLSAAYLLAALALFMLLIRLGVKTTTESFVDLHAWHERHDADRSNPRARLDARRPERNTRYRGLRGRDRARRFARLAGAGGDLHSVGDYFVCYRIVVGNDRHHDAAGDSCSALATGADLSVTIGAVLSGGLFGDHSSPISETTILSSTGAGTTPLAHFQTQLPYALTNGVIAFACFVAAGLTASTSLVFVAIAAQLAVLLVIRYRLNGRQA